MAQNQLRAGKVSSATAKQLGEKGPRLGTKAPGKSVDGYGVQLLAGKQKRDGDTRLT